MKMQKDFYNYININKVIMLKNISLIFISVLLLLMLSLSSAQGAVKLDNDTYIIDDVVGIAELNKSKKEARENAKHFAYQNALKIFINEFPIFKSLENKIISNAAKLVKNFSIINETLDQDGKLHISGTCKIDEKTLEKLIFTDIIKINNPKVMLIFNEKIGGKLQTSSIAQKETKKLLEKAGYSIVIPEQAKPIISIDVSKVYNDPKMLYDVARTLRADAVIIGNANASAFATKKYLGATFYGVSGSVQLKVIITQNSQEIPSKTV